MIFETHSEEETVRLGMRLAREARPGMIWCLDGDLGAGKTAFTRGIARGLGIGAPIVSPTFTILKVYEDGRLPLYHFDVYRLEGPEELEAIGYEEYFYGAGLTVVEWPSQVEELIPPEAAWIRIERVPEKGEAVRRFTADLPEPDITKA